MNPELFEWVDALYKKFGACAPPEEYSTELTSVRLLLKTAPPRERVEAILHLMSSRLYGLDEQLRLLFLSVIGGLRVIMTGSPATGKNNAFYRLSELLGLDWRVVTKNEVSSKSAVFAIYNPRSLQDRSQPEYLPGPALLADSLLIDEWSVLNPQIKGEVHHLLEDGKFANIPAKAKFIVLAQNPEIQDLYGGSYEEKNLATMSRTEVALTFSQPGASASQFTILKFAKSGRREPPLPAITSWEETAESARKEIMNVKVPGKVIFYLVMLGLELTSCRALDEGDKNDKTPYDEDKMSIPPQMLNKLCEICELRTARISGMKQGFDNVSICSRFSAPMGRVDRATTILAQSLAWLDGRDEVRVSDIMEAAKHTLYAVVVDSTNQFITTREIKNILTAFEQNQQRRLMQRASLGKNEMGEDSDSRYVILSIVAEAQEKHVMDNDKMNLLLTEFKSDYPFYKYIVDFIGHVYDVEVRRFWDRMIDATNPIGLDAIAEQIKAAGLKQEDLAVLLSKIDGKRNGDFIEIEYDGSPPSMARLVRTTIAILRMGGDKTTTPTQVTNTIKKGSFQSPIITISSITGPVLTKLRVSAAKPLLEKFRDMMEE